MNLYEFLEISEDAGAEAIRVAIARQSTGWSKRAAMAPTPERKQEAQVALGRVAEARQTLLDPGAKQAYDATLFPLLALPGQAPAAGPYLGEEVVKRRPCPICGELIAEAARKCRYCNEWLEARAEVPAAELRHPVAPARASTATDAPKVVYSSGRGTPILYSGSVADGLTFQIGSTQATYGAAEIAALLAHFPKYERIPLGASMSAPPEGSVGAFITAGGKSNLASFLVPVLVEEGFATTDKAGRAVMVRFTGKPIG